MIKSHFDEPSFQGTLRTYGDSNSKDWGSKASIGTYRKPQFSCGVGLPSKIPWQIHMNSWLKLRDKEATKRELMSLQQLRQHILTIQAMTLGTHGGKSCDSAEQITSGVKREP